MSLPEQHEPEGSNQGCDTDLTEVEVEIEVLVSAFLATCIIDKVIFKGKEINDGNSKGQSVCCQTKHGVNEVEIDSEDSVSGLILCLHLGDKLWSGVDKGRNFGLRIGSVDILEEKLLTVR